MRIGIITFWSSKDNYGQALQCFALQQFLRNCGHNPFLIRYKDNPKDKLGFKFRNIGRYMLRFPLYVKLLIQKRQRNENEKLYHKATEDQKRNFESFYEINISYTENIYSSNEIGANPPLADAYICGSDQIWGGDFAYYLDFAPKAKFKIAYAASLGGVMHFDTAYERKMQHLISRLDFVGMRESSGVEVCHRLGRKDAVKVADPTLLLSKDDYDKIRKPIKHDKPYALLYILGNPMICDIDNIVRYVRQRKLDFKYVASSGQYDAYEHIPAQIGEWIDLIANAEIVITNSFHGTVFSMIYHRPFISIPLNKGYERMNTRLNDIMKETGLEDRLYHGNWEKIPDSVDFSTFDEYKSMEIKRTIEFLSPYIKLSK